MLKPKISLVKKKLISNTKSLSFLVALVWAIISFGCSSGKAPVFKAGKAIAINSEIKPDTHFVSLIKPYKQKIDSVMSQVLGEAETEMPKIKAPETSLGNWMADVYLEETKTIYKQTQAAFVASGGIRAGVPKGNFCLGNAFEIMPFENELALMQLKGSMVHQLIKHHLENKNLNFSGITASKTGKDFSAFIDGKLVQPDSLYWVATSDYLANGGDNLGFLKNRIGYLPTNKKVRDAIVLNVKKLSQAQKKISAPKIDRIQLF